MFLAKSHERHETRADTYQKYSLTKVIQVLSAMAIFLAGLEVGLIFALKVCLLVSVDRA
jgi:hypothetical protein